MITGETSDLIALRSEGIGNADRTDDACGQRVRAVESPNLLRAKRELVVLQDLTTVFVEQFAEIITRKKVIPQGLRGAQATPAPAPRFSKSSAEVFT